MTSWANVFHIIVHSVFILRGPRPGPGPESQVPTSKKLKIYEMHMKLM